MDFFKQALCIGDRVAFVTNKGTLQHAQIVEFVGEMGPYREVRLHTIGNRFTTVRCQRCVKEPL